jgi:hypothetical protein
VGEVNSAENFGETGRILNMVVNKILIKAVVLLCLMILPTSLSTIYAQGPDEEESIVIAPSGQLNLTFEQLGYDTKELSQDRSTRHYGLDLPGNFQISPAGNYLDLIISHLPETPEKPSLLEVNLNGRLLSSFSLTEENAISSTVRIELPGGLLRTDDNSIAIGLDTGATCKDPGGFLRVLIDENSTLSFGYQQNPYPANLGLYPFPFTEQSLLNIPVTIVLPDQPTPDDLSAAATVAAGLGQMSGGTIDLTTVLVSNLPPDIRDNNHLIVLGQPGTNVLLNDLGLPLPIDQATLESGQGVLQEIVSPWNEFRLVLVVSGLDDEGVLKASQALNRQAHFLGLRGPVAIVVQLGPLSKSTVSDTTSFTLASLGYEDRTFYGTLPQDYTFRFTLPLGWQLDESPFLVLKFAHADIISSESAMDVTLNGVPIGSTLLDDSNVDEGELRVSLPRRRLKTGQNQLGVNVEMGIPNIDDPCDGIGNERAWTVVSNESEIFLPYTALDLPPDLSLFPYPFSQASGFDQTVILLPDQSSSQTFNELMQLVVRLGSASQAEDISVQVSYASEVEQDIHQDHHLILLGRPTENLFLAEINDYLPQPFASGSDILEPLVVDSVAFLPDPDRDAGLLEIIESPWNEEYSILALTGTTSEGVRLAVQTLLEQTQQLEGNLAVVEPIFNPFSDEPNQVSTYSVDTRSRVPINQEASGTNNNTLSEKDLSALANRWWK